MSEMDPPSPMSSGGEKNVAVHLSDGGGNEVGSLRNFIRKKETQVILRRPCGHWVRKIGAMSCGPSWPRSSGSSLSLAIGMALGTLL